MAMQKEKEDSPDLLTILGRNKTALLAGALLGLGAINPIPGAIGLGIGIGGAIIRHGKQDEKDMRTLGDAISRAAHDAHNDSGR